MLAEPDRASFVREYEAGRPQVVWTSLVADLETPVSALLKLADGRPWSFLLESVEGGAIRGRYSIIGLKPDLVWRCRGERAEINRRARIDREAFVPEPLPALASLRALIRESRIPMPPGLPPPAAGLFGYMAYDMVRLMERLPAIAPDPLGLPDAIFVRPTIVAVFDNLADQVTLVTPVWPTEGLSAARAWDLAQERLFEAVEDFDRGIRHEPPRRDVVPVEPQPMMSREAFEAMVRRCKEYIAAGDAFQIVISQRFTVPFSLPPLALYRALRRLNPSPFLFFLDFGAFALVGSSPEILVRLRDGKVTIRPLAGTRRRGATREEDEALAAEMLADPKERAEHLMLLDLGRNDVGRVAQVGTVRVTEKMVVERYSHVMHISSNVEGLLRPDLEALDALVAGFPAGTVSGAPKVRAMEIIEELEPVRRSFYAGTIGYFAADGSMDTCIGLRTALVKDGAMIVQAGAGIVHDSDPAAEYQETLNKARALVRAAEEAVRFATRGR
ncbi:MAG: anthranilate synthase component I [Geminicoccaceae bacterium]|nr:anthranilate synthase component I [Geminicoccaceae bacterium]MCS7268229.1 anthranilate synthase component I [Geminicoccaceae bacterium]MCX7629415.1 anthranilate synthase component I [Geminicoccaceae bacterium]MDW8125001.1 anthranilate synthase component I [Geminicoccaceae bacterium]MDW8341212.1 anthranilate synthase component I [Geminicoccaceae bacterium]